LADRTARWQSDTEHLKAKRLTRDPDQAISASLLRKPGTQLPAEKADEAEIGAGCVIKINPGQPA
jgi:hypothetical protein